MEIGVNVSGPVCDGGRAEEMDSRCCNPSDLFIDT